MEGVASFPLDAEAIYKRTGPSKVDHFSGANRPVHHFFLVPLLVAFTTSGPGARGESQLLKIARVRAQITSGELLVRVHFSVFDSTPNLVGADWDLHYWFESDRKAFRLDESRSKDLAEGAPTAFRFAFDGKSYRLISQVGEPRSAIREFVKTKPLMNTQLFDARLLGVYPESFMVLQNYSLNDVDRLVWKADTWSRQDFGDGFKETYIHKSGVTYEYFFSKDGSPVRFVVDAEKTRSRRRREMRIEFDRTRRDRFLIPAKIGVKEYESNKLVLDEDLTIEVVQLNVPIDRSVCSWAALSPMVGSRLFIDSKYDEPIGLRWNGFDFEQYIEHPAKRPGPEPPQKDEGSASRTRPYLFLTSLICAVALAIMLAFRWVQKARGSM